ncbi:RNA dependent RNA polymerase-domain-containing protein [Mycena vitilis]|nr:RNA dependent RNA polymerase-domain-containing protein [Mycena vitilis]
MSSQSDIHSEDSEDELWSTFASSSSQISSRPPTSSFPALTTASSSSTRPLKRRLPSCENLSDRATKKCNKTHNISFTKSVLQLKERQPFIIAGFQDVPDEDNFRSVLGLPTGVCWEIARLISMGRLPNIALDDVHQLTGSNTTAAPKTVETIMKEKMREISIDAAFAAERKSQSPWEELDYEKEALRLDPNAALGNCSQYPKRYGGKVCFTGTIEVAQDKVNVVLDRCTLSSSYRLGRRFGSSSFLRLKIPARILHSPDNRLKEFFQNPFIIFGSVFRSFYAKDATVFLFRTREKYSQGTIQDSTDGLSLFEFLDQFNPLKLNEEQALCKWASRFALGLSNSVPGPIIDPANAEEHGDFMSPSRSNMTDGCGLSNLAFNIKLRFDFQLEATPCAVQVRHGGRKGMLLMYPDSTLHTVPKIAFRTPSQVKITYGDEAKAHPANSTVDILRFSRTKCPARISPEVIINLEHNGVPAEVFISMQNKFIAEGVNDLLQWAKEPGPDTPEAMLRLWKAVENAEGVYYARRVREAAGEARFRGFGERYNDAAQEEEEEDPDLFDTAIHERSTAWWPDYISGCPSSLAETVMALLDSGFTPKSLPVLRAKLKQIVQTKIRYRSQHFKYDVLQSAGAFVVPDSWGVLEENQIHFKSSRREFTTDDGLETDTIIGDVLMTRNPCKVPSDVRKLQAVKHSQLHDLVDVIVCSVKGERRLLDFLAGGDYDGDRAIVIWDKAIVDPFTNASETFSDEPEGLDTCFTRDETTVKSFNAAYAEEPQEVKAAELQKYLLGSLRDPSAVGQYSGYHDNWMVQKGYDHPQTIELAYKFCKILDSSKTGYNIKQDTRNADAKMYGHGRGPAWKNHQKEAAGFAMNTLPLMRKVDQTNPRLSRPFIMDVLGAAATSREEAWLTDAQRLFEEVEKEQVVFDPDLAKPWKDFADFVVGRVRKKDMNPKKDLVAIGEHVRNMYRRHSEEVRKGQPKSSSNTRGGFTDRPIEVRQDALRTLSRDFAASPSPEQLLSIFDPVIIARLRASYAYIYDHEESSRFKDGWTRFPWNMALGDLCKIKAAAAGPHKAVTVNFYERFKLGGDRRG